MAVWRSGGMTERVRLRYLTTMSALVSTRSPVPRGWATSLSRVLPSLSVRRTRKLLSALCKRELLPRKLAGFVPLQIPYGCTCDQYDRCHCRNGPSCDPLHALALSL